VSKKEENEAKDDNDLMDEEDALSMRFAGSITLSED